MRPEELMIGDWYYWEADGKKYYYQVTKETFSSPDYDIYNFQPIPLTPEILEKNGFYHKTNVGYIDDDYNGRQIIYDFWNHNLKIMYNYKTMLDIEGWLDHIHIHELQHALKLCGIDKTIEL